MSLFNVTTCNLALEMSVKLFQQLLSLHIPERVVWHLLCKNCNHCSHNQNHLLLEVILGDMRCKETVLTLKEEKKNVRER